MKKNTLLLTLALAAVTSIASAQDGDKYVVLRSIEKGKKGNTVNINFDVDYDRLRLARQQELIVTPLIVSGRDTSELDPVVFSGRKRAKVESRKDRLQRGYDLGYEDPYLTMIVNRHTPKRVKNTDTHSSVVFDNLVPYQYTAPYQSWMRGSRVVLKQELRGCNNASDTYYTSLGSLYDPVSPRLTYMIPQPARETKRETMAAEIIFRQDKYEIRRDLGRNGMELDRMYEMTERIRDNASNDVKGLSIHGVASPEAPYPYNERLAMNRAVAVKNHLRDKYGIDDSMFELSVTPEDWASVRSLIAASDMRYRNEVIKIIDETPDPDARDARIRALDGGRTYREIYDNIYPGLRRVEYTIDYQAGPMPLDEARRMINTAPESMSAAEIHTVLASYPADSQESEKVLAILHKFYPDDVVANNNLAARAIGRKDLPAARRHLERISGSAEAQNNLGVLNALEGRYEEAAQNFRNAAGRGSAEAAFNLENLESLE